MPKHGFVAWAITIYPLVLHCITAASIAAFMIHYVDDRHFKLTERMPWQPLAGRVKIRLSEYVLLQSDIITILSSAFIVLRFGASGWNTSLRWRSAFLLMEIIGLRKQKLHQIIVNGTVKPHSNKHRITTVVVCMLLLVPMVAQLSSAVLISSLAWIPSNRLVTPQSDVKLNIPVVTNSDEWNTYSDLIPLRQWAAHQAADLVDLAWWRKPERDVLKRVLPSTARLNINSNVTNVTLPYFSVTALEWVADPVNTLPPEQLDPVKISANLSALGAVNPLRSGVGVLIRDTPWNATEFPAAAAVSETRTLVLYTHNASETGGCGSSQSEIFGSLSPGMGFIQQDLACYAFARVTYSAGASVCINCQVSSYITVQSGHLPPLEKDFMTTEALRLMADVTMLLVQSNSSIPLSWGHTDDYVIGVLSRSYSGAWSALTNYLGQSSLPLTSSFSASIRSVRAQVDSTRVYIWLTIQLSVILSGVVFLLVQSRSQYRLIGSTALAAFELDTADATVNDVGNDSGLMKLEQKGDGFKVVVSDGYSM